MAGGEMEASALRVRDRFLVHQVVQELYTDHGLRTAAWAPPREIVAAIAEGLWEPREGSTDREAALGILRGVKKLLKLLKGAGKRAWSAFSRALGLDELEGLSLIAKVKAIASRVKDLAKRGKDALGKALKKMSLTFPLSLFFVPKGKMPGLTDLMARIAKKSPTIWRFVQKIKGKLDVADKWMKEHAPRLSKVLLGAIFIFIWFNVAELSWDFEGLLAGFSGTLSLPDLLASLPESALGFLFAGFGLGYGALPVTLIMRLVWLVAHKYLSYVPGRGLVVHWDKMGVIGEGPEMVPTT
jgi:hypothetical protein